ncbi:MAG TPA: MlaD family protein [Gemmatimonadaceae bacterium]|nr:MlaD family protein [Gemmatimonadaceae bacterium]
MKRSSFITWDQLKVGSLILIALAVLAIALYKLGKAVNLFSKRYELHAFLKEAGGLRIGGSVMVAGQLAGTIKEIEFLPIDNDTLRNLEIVVALDEALKEQVRGDSKARVRTLGLLGDKIIDISPGTPRFAVLQDGDTVSVQPSLDYDEVLTKAASAVDDVVGLTKDLGTLTRSLVAGKGTVGQLLTNPALYNQLESTLGRTNALLYRVQTSRGTLARFLDDPRLYDEMVGAIGGVDSLLVAMRSRNGSIGRLLTDTTLYAQGVATIQSFAAIAANADTLMKGMAAGKGMAGKMLTDDELYMSLQKLVTDFSALIADIRKDPSRYTKGLVNLKVF